jgi:cardiolipin synthase
MSSSGAALGGSEWRKTFEQRLQTQAKLARLGHFPSVATGLPRFFEGNHAFYLRDGKNQLAWMLAAIDNARLRVDLEMYIFDPDETGVLVRDALAAAAARGVVVRLQYDSIGSSTAGPAFFQPIIDAGGTVVEFNPVAPWRLRMSRIGKLQLWRINARDHRKLLVCDVPARWVEQTRGGGEAKPPEAGDAEGDSDRVSIAILGGRNIADNYLLHALGEGQWRDCGVVIFGPVVLELAAMFDAMWFHAEGPDRMVPKLRAPPAGDLFILPMGSQPGFFNPLQWAMSRLALHVREELRISCAYFVPSVRLRKALISAARGPRTCSILLPKASDVPVVDMASRHLWGALLKAGVSIFLYALDVLHEKTLVYDRVVTVVGSSNLDPRSFRLNYELSVIVLGESFARPVVRGHELDLQNAEPYTLAQWRARPLWQKLTDWFWALLRSQL